MVILIYVDDILIISNDNQESISLKQFLYLSLKLKDLCYWKYFLRLEVARSHLGIYACQRKYAFDLLSET